METGHNPEVNQWIYTKTKKHSHALSEVSQAGSQESTWLREGSTQCQIITPLVVSEVVGIKH